MMILSSGRGWINLADGVAHCSSHPAASWSPGWLMALTGSTKRVRHLAGTPISHYDLRVTTLADKEGRDVLSAARPRSIDIRARFTRSRSPRSFSPSTRTSGEIYTFSCEFPGLLTLPIQLARGVTAFRCGS